MNPCLVCPASLFFGVCVAVKRCVCCGSSSSADASALPASSAPWLSSWPKVCPSRISVFHLLAHSAQLPPRRGGRATSETTKRQRAEELLCKVSASSQLIIKSFTLRCNSCWLTPHLYIPKDPWTDAAGKELNNAKTRDILPTQAAGEKISSQECFQLSITHSVW